MQALSKLYPEFVLPLPRESSDGVKGAEMIFLQWGALPSGTSSTLPTSVLFTSLAAYKTHGTFAQPALCVTHYTDLADSHGVVLLRGEITASESSGQALMSPTDAQLLLLRLQQYYAADEGTEQRDLVESFHGKGSREFDVDKLAATAWSLT
jgi:ATP synthase F1 complex assembly factor 1